MVPQQPCVHKRPPVLILPAAPSYPPPAPPKSEVPPCGDSGYGGSAHEPEYMAPDEQLWLFRDQIPVWTGPKYGEYR